jgi:CSLREA domain-containing protein
MLEQPTPLTNHHRTPASTLNPQSPSNFFRAKTRAVQSSQSSNRISLGVLLALTILTSCGTTSLLAPIAPTSLTVINVNSTTDSVDAKPGDFICADTRGQCSLRAAIMESNDATGVQTVELPAGTYNLTLAGAGEDNSKTGDLDIRSEMIFNGANAASTIVNANGLDRAFHLPRAGLFDKGFPVRVSNLTVRGGTVSGQGGSWSVEWDDVDLTMRNLTFDGNSSTIAGGGLAMSSSSSTMNLDNINSINNTTGGDGGGLYIDGSTDALITNSSFTGNSARASETRDQNTGGGGIRNLGKLELSDSIISANTVPNAYGGGLLTTGNVTIKRSSISKNVANACGGGLASPDSRGAITVDSSSVTENRAINGAGICSISGPMTLTNATVSKNQASSLGGGIWSGSNVTLTHTTLAENTAVQTTGLDLYFNTDRFSTITVRASVLASTGGSVCAQAGGGTSGFTSSGANVVADASCGFASANDVQSSAATLSALSPVSNRVFSVMVPTASSPAINRVPSSLCITLDARGVTRPQGAACDAGAVERTTTDP